MPLEAALSELAGERVHGHDLRGVLRIAAFRRLWIALSLSSLGDWLGLLAITALATELGSKGSGGFAAANFAVGGVLMVRLLPAIVLGPFAGAFADRFDRRRTMVFCDLVRFSFFVSIPLVGSLTYLFIAQFVIEAVSLFWIPAKEASVPNLVPRERLEAANQLSLLTTYGSAPVASVVFVLLALFSNALGAGITFFSTNPTDLAMYFNATSFLFSALTVLRIKEISGHRAKGASRDEAAGLLSSITEGWSFAKGSPLVRGLLVGMLGAFAAGGVVIGLGKQYVTLLDAGNAGYGVLFGAVFTGLALGMFFGPRLLAGFSRRRLFGLSITGAGLSLTLMAVMPNLVLAVIAVLAVGGFAGVSWVTGYTLLGLEVADEVRGRTFALVQSLVRVDLLLVLALGPLIAGLIGQNSAAVGSVAVRLDGVTVTLFVAGLLAATVGVLAFRQLDDRPHVSLRHDLLASLRGETAYAPRAAMGLFVAFEGGEGTGKSTQVALLAQWLAEKGHEVVVTREPGGTVTGRAVRAILLDPATGGLSPRAEALLYAADRAEHVATLVRPALHRRAVVVTDRYVDSSLAYQGAGRALDAEEVARLSRWATEGLRPDLTVLLDLDPASGLERAAGRAASNDGVGVDRIEAETLDFHQRVRAEFLALAQRDSRRYVVVDAAGSPDTVASAVRAAVALSLAAHGLDAPAGTPAGSHGG